MTKEFYATLAEGGKAETGQTQDLLLRLAHEERRCVIVVTHDLSIAARADAVLELRDGRLLPTSEQR